MFSVSSTPSLGFDGLVCPYCQGGLQQVVSGASCEQCRAEFQGLRGILDLRTDDDEYLSNARDWEIARALDSEFDHRDFRELLDYYYDLIGEVPGDLRDRQIAHIMTASARAEQWMSALGSCAETGTVLDLGCGPGGFLASRPLDGRSWVGLDIAMRWLVIARKQLAELGNDAVLLVCGCAESLPFRDETFAGIVAGDVVEHVRCRASMLSECHRVLSRGSRMIAATPNRFSLAPEPHVNVWGVGFLPRAWMSAYVQWMRRTDFRAITTHGWFGWRRLARSSPFSRWKIVAPLVPEQADKNFKQPMVRVYNRLARTWAGQFALRVVGPLFHMTFEKAPRSSQATPQRSRSTGVRR